MQANDAAECVTDQMAAADIQPVEHARQLIGHILHAVTGRNGALTQAGAVLVINHHAKILCQYRQLRLPETAGTAQP
ncbi:hypothetical protein COLO4_02046 [Corchorus olitorius]|uniref:Uncharacterized protein n=1 Tax=Corchorus olitorius TaxID=93759 RepID=A0A1R3L1S2_9ROSI|nr:hypothetical protein COLO4_02046 [Corchorus olitorius]